MDSDGSMELEGKYLDLEVKAEKLFDLRARISIKIAESINGVGELMIEYRKVSAEYNSVINQIANID